MPLGANARLLLVQLCVGVEGVAIRVIGHAVRPRAHVRGEGGGDRVCLDVHEVVRVACALNTKLRPPTRRRRAQLAPQPVNLSLGHMRSWQCLALACRLTTHAGGITASPGKWDFTKSTAFKHSCARETACQPRQRRLTKGSCKTAIILL